MLIQTSITDHVVIYQRLVFQSLFQRNKMFRSISLGFVFLFCAGSTAADVRLSNDDVRTYSLLSRLNSLVDSSGLVQNYPACIYDEITGTSLSEADSLRRLDGVEWGINHWVKGMYGDEGYEGFVVQQVSLDLLATTLADCDALGDNPQPIRITKWDRCGGLMKANKVRCPVHNRTGITLHEIGHMIGLPHEFSYYDPDADHPLGPASVMNYEYLTLPNLTASDIETARWAWKKSQNNLDAACEDGKVHLTHACLPAYFGDELNVEREIRIGDTCLDLSGYDVITTACNGQQKWNFKYSNSQLGYVIENSGKCLGLTPSVVKNVGGLPVEVFDSSVCELSPRTVWGVRLWGDNVQIQNSAHFYQNSGFDSNGCLALKDNPVVGNCGDWDNFASPMYKTTNTSVLELSSPSVPLAGAWVSVWGPDNTTTQDTVSSGSVRVSTDNLKYCFRNGSGAAPLEVYEISAYSNSNIPLSMSISVAESWNNPERVIDSVLAPASGGNASLRADNPNPGYQCIEVNIKSGMTEVTELEINHDNEGSWKVTEVEVYAYQ